MTVTLEGTSLHMIRTESDKPKVQQPYPRPEKVTPAEFNSWRGDYWLYFTTQKEAEAALVKVKSIGDFDEAARWLDKQ